MQQHKIHITLHSTYHFKW